MASRDKLPSLTLREGEAPILQSIIPAFPAIVHAFDKLPDFGYNYNESNEL